MKQKKNKLSFSIETVRALSAALTEDQLREVAGGTTVTNWSLRSKCIETGGATCQM